MDSSFFIFPDPNGPLARSWNMVLDQIATELNKSAKFMDVFASLSSNSERVLLCFTNDTVSKLIQDYMKLCKSALGRGKKESARAASLRLRANESFGQKQFWEALQGYSRALMFAPEDSEAPLLYGNRSATFYQLEQYENALDDIERAFSLGYARLKPDGKGKLMIRKAECLLRLGRNEELKSLFECDPNETPKDARWEQLKSLSTITKRTVTKRDVNLSKFTDSETVIQALIEKKKFTPHERFSWLNRKVDLCYDEKKGFKLISNEKLAFGEVAAVGKPFVGLFGFLKDQTSLLNDESLQNDTRHATLCHYCQNSCLNSMTRAQSGSQKDSERTLEIQQLSSGPFRVFAPLPCTQCSNVLYCSEYCRTEAWNFFHKFECSQFAILAVGSLTLPLLALRMLYSAGSLEKIKQVVSEWESVPDRLEMLKNPRDYAFIYSIRQPEGRDLQEDLRMAVTACFLVKLAQMSGFVPNSTKDELFAAGILLRHLLQVKAHRWLSTMRNGELGIVSQVHGIYGLMEHSCNYNIRPFDISWACHVIQSNVKILYASRSIEAHTELNIIHGLGFSLDQPADSRTVINCTRHSVDYFKMFRFTCKCTRCLQERRDALISPNGAYYPIACSSCGSLMIRPADGTLSDGSYRCSSTAGCNLVMTHSQMKTAYGQVERLLALHQEAVALLPSAFQPVSLSCQNKLSQLKECIAGTVHRLYRGSPLLAHLYDRLFQLLFSHYTIMASMSVSGDGHVAVKETFIAAWECLQKQVNVLEERFGGSLADNLEVAGAMLPSFTMFTLGKNEQHLEIAISMMPQVAKIFERLKAAQKMIEFDRIVTSPSP